MPYSSQTNNAVFHKVFSIVHSKSVDCNVCSDHCNKCFLPDVKGTERNKWDNIWWDFRQVSCVIIEQEFIEKQPYFVVNILAYKEQIYKHSLILIIR